MDVGSAEPEPVAADTPSLLPLIGRQHELDQLWACYKAAREGCVRVALVAGDPGIGKTRLLEDLAVRSACQGALVLRGSASEAEGMPPLLPFLEVFDDYLRTAPPQCMLERVALVSQPLSSIMPELAERLGDVTPDIPVSPEQARLRLYEAVGSFLAAMAAQQPLVLLLDDLHSADAASLDLLCHIVRRQPHARLLICGAYREGDLAWNPALARALDALLRQRALTTVTLEALSGAETAELAMAYLAGPISPSLTQLLYTQSEGNPFFAEELLHSWSGMGTLVQEGETWTTAASLERSLPASIVVLLRQRLARLSPTVLEYLRTAAIIGKTFDVALLAEVSGQAAAAVEEALREAIRARLVRIEPDGSFRFSHDNVRGYLYDDVGPWRRRHLHATIGRALETQCSHKGNATTYQLMAITHHYARADDRIRSALFAQAAADQTMRTLAVQQARASYRRARQLAGHAAGPHGGIPPSLGTDASKGAQDAQDAQDETRLGNVSLPTDREYVSRAVQEMALPRQPLQTLPAARAALEHALAIQGNQPRIEMLQVLLDLATLLAVDMGQPAEGRCYADRALEIAHRLGDSQMESSTYQTMMQALCVYGSEIDASVHVLERALMLAEVGDNPPEAADSARHLATLHYCRADMRRSHEMMLRHLALTERSERAYPSGPSSQAHPWFALLSVSYGDWATAEQILARAHAVSGSAANLVRVALGHQVHAFLAYQREDYVAAQRELVAAATITAHLPSSPESLLLSPGLLGLVWVALGRHSEARAIMAELEQLLAQMPIDTLATAPLLMCLALMAVGLGDRERAVHLYPRLVAFQGQQYWFLVDRVLGILATLSGDWEAATAHLSTAEATARREGLFPELAHTLAAQADLELASGRQGSTERAESLSGEAHEIFRHLSMPIAARRVPHHRRHQPSSHQSGRCSWPEYPAGLSPREAAILRLVATGKTNYQIARELQLSEKTVANHLTRVFEKTGSESRAGAAAFAIRHGIV